MRIKGKMLFVDEMTEEQAKAELKLLQAKMTVLCDCGAKEKLLDRGAVKAFFMEDIAQKDFLEDELYKVNNFLGKNIATRFSMESTDWWQEMVPDFLKRFRRADPTREPRIKAKENLIRSGTFTSLMFAWFVDLYVLPTAVADRVDRTWFPCQAAFIKYITSSDRFKGQYVKSSGTNLWLVGRPGTSGILAPSPKQGNTILGWFPTIELLQALSLIED